MDVTGSSFLNNVILTGEVMRWEMGRWCGKRCHAIGHKTITKTKKTHSMRNG